MKGGTNLKRDLTHRGLRLHPGEPFSGLGYVTKKKNSQSNTITIGVQFVLLDHAVEHFGYHMIKSNFWNFNKLKAHHIFGPNIVPRCQYEPPSEYTDNGHQNKYDLISSS